MTILWDGTANAPYGKMLFAEQSVIITPPPPLRPLEYTDTRRKVKAMSIQLGDTWWTAAEMAELVKVPLQPVASAISGLVRHGDLRKERKRCMRGRIEGSEKQRYQVSTK